MKSQLMDLDLNQTNVGMFEVTLKLAENYSDSTELNNPRSEAFKSFKEKVQPEIHRLCGTVCDSPEIDIVQYKSSGAAHFIIFKLTSRGSSDESTMKKRIETKIQTGTLDFSLKVSTSGLTLQKLTVFYEVSLNVKKQFTDELKKKHSGEFNAFSKQGSSGTVSSDVILEIISHGCTDEVVVRQPIKDLIAVGKLELTLKTSATDFSFKTNGYNVLPSKDDISDGAKIAIIKHYRNELAHASDAKMDEQNFDDIWSNLENAIKHLGKGDENFMIAVNDAFTRKLDSDSEEMLIKMVQLDKQLLELDESVTQHNKQIETIVKQAKQSACVKIEISQIKEEIGKIEEQILKIRTSFQTFNNLFHRLYEKFRVQDERNVRQDEMNRNMESGIQKNIRDIQRLHPQSEASCSVCNAGAVRRLESSEHSTKQLYTDVGQRPDNSSKSPPDITGSSSQKTKFIKQYYEKLPKEYKVGYYDVMILYSSDDRSEAEKFCAHLKRDIYQNQPGKIKAVLYDGPEFEGISLSKFEHFEKGFKRCTFTFVYLIKQFVECDWSSFLAETCLMEAIYNPDKKWCFVPVYTVPIQRADFEIPIQIKPLKEIRYYNPDEFYLHCVRRLIGDKIYQRKENDKILEEKCFKFLVEKVGEDEANDQRLLNEHEDQ
ncbi:unnamed protein product [Mytilus coruscus]|uniref:DZIP3-like HEPN domain-containing protein n=1 Tax=Mytilus coruscus TaxID=42192 RepID=A0A6J8BC45_MYTCO|nr:unnamed protein product [Mytilus coruscus]